MINEKIYNLKLTEGEEEYLQEQLKKYREEKTRERRIEKTKERIRNDIKELYDFITPSEVADFIEEIKINHWFADKKEVDEFYCAYNIDHF